MITKWCPVCRREFSEPSADPISNYAKFFRDECYICGSRLRSIEKSSASPDAESLKRDKLKYEVDQLRFEYEKHQRNIQALLTKVDSLEHELEKMERNFENFNERDTSDWPDSEKIFNQFISSMDSYRNNIGDYRKQISIAEKKMTEIQRALDARSS